MKDVLLDFLITERGVISSPKSDGRIEIPQNIIKTMGWNKHKTIFVKKIPSGLLLTDKDINTNMGKIVVSYGRVRIPFKILKSVGLNGKKINLTCEDGNVVIKASNTELRKNIIELLDGFCDHCEDRLKKVVNFILGNVEELTIKKEEFTPHKNATFCGSPLIIKTPKNNKKEPCLFLLDKNELVFRPIGMPFRFPGYYLKLKNELTLYRNFENFTSPNIFYLIPGIKVSTRSIGFLLINEQIYGNIVYIQGNEHTNFDRDLIFIYRPFSSAMYKVYRNPPLPNINENEINFAKQVCNDPKSFLEKIFRYIEQDDINLIAVNVPPLTQYTLENFKCKSKTN